MAYRGQQKKPIALPEVYSTSPAGSPGPAGTEEHREEVDSGGVKEATVTNVICSVSGDQNNVLTISSNEGRSVPLAGNLQPPPTVISCTMLISDIADFLIRHECKDITSEFDFEGCSPNLFRHHGPGAIYSGYLRCGQPVAIKCVEAPGRWASWKLEVKSLKHAAHELYAWSKCNHPGILNNLGFARFGGHILLISPWMKNGSLVHYLDKNPESDRLELSLELSSALVYLHSMDIIHGDIKAENVIMSDDGHAQLGDFGSAILLNYSSVDFTETGFKGTLRFTAPELLDWEKGNKPTVKSDIYALGMTILQIMTGKPPYADRSTHTVPNEVLVKKRIPDRPNLSMIFRSPNAENSLWCLLTRCWVHEPARRPTATEVEDKLVNLVRLEQIHRPRKLDDLSEPKQPTDILQHGAQHHLQTADRKAPILPKENLTTILSNSPVPPSPQMKILPQMSIPKRQLEPLVIDTGSPKPLASPENEVFYDVLESWPETPIQPPASGPYTCGTKKALHSIHGPIHGVSKTIASLTAHGHTPTSFTWHSAPLAISDSRLAKKKALIGMNYKQRGSSQLRYATQDARRFAATVSKLGYSDENIEIVTDEPGQQLPSREYLLECMDRLVQDASPGDLGFC